MLVARKVCLAENLELLEASAENTSGVAEAVTSLISRGAQTIVVGGDITVSAAIDVVISLTTKAGIPVLTALPDQEHPARGTLADIGADFFAAGKVSGMLAGDILHGADPKVIPIRDAADIVGLRVFVNKKVLAKLKDPWAIPDDVVQKADIVVDESGVHRKNK
jgi:putative ABC transport system substrate-binding protein